MSELQVWLLLHSGFFDDEGLLFENVFLAVMHSMLDGNP